MKTLSEIKDLISFDSIGKNKSGNYVVRFGYFYRHGNTSEKYAAGIKVALPDANIVAHGDHYANFRGGASVAKSSHFWVEFNFPETPATDGVHSNNPAQEFWQAASLR